MKEGQLEQAAFELSQALKIIIGDIKSKPNDTRYLTSLKVGANALLKYDELRFSKEGQTQGPVGGMKWVKASERLPHNEWGKFCKIGAMMGLCFYRKAENIWTDETGVKYKSEHITWLDENHTPLEVREKDKQYWWDRYYAIPKERGWRRFGTSDHVDALIEEMIKAGYAASLPQSSTGGLPKLDHPILDDDDVKGIIESSTEEEKDSFAISFAIWALHDPQAKAYQEAGITAYGLLEKYKDRPYINTDTSKQ